jgi:CheY-like chemotaxis protein
MSDQEQNKRRLMLVAEDDPNDVHLLELALRNAPPNVDFKIVRDGVEAVAYLNGERPFEDRQANPFPDLVLLDLRMPKLDGLQVLRWIRSAPATQHLKVAVWADSQFQSRANEVLEAGANRIIKKPESIEGLRRILCEFCGVEENKRNDSA